jgi:hypothetical protein
MGKFRPRVEPEEIYTFRMLGVSVLLDLWKVVEEIQNKLRTIIAIHRVVDHANNRRCEEIFISIRSPLEYAALKEMKFVNVDGNDIKLEFDVYYCGTAIRPSYVTWAPPGEINASSIGMKLSNLTAVSSITSIYIKKILFGFEILENATITGINLVYDQRRDATRPFGFLYFIDLQSMLKYHCHKFKLYDEIFYCEGSYRTPIILSERDKSLIDSTPATFNDQIGRANMLNRKIETNDNDSELAAAVENINLNITEVNEGNSKEPIDEDESILSCELDFDFDEDMNLIQKF